MKPSTPVLFQKFVDLFERELVQADNPRLRTIGRRQRVPRFGLGFKVDDDPSAMIAVTATEVGVRQVMGPGLQKKPHRTRTRTSLGSWTASMRNPGWAPP